MSKCAKVKEPVVVFRPHYGGSASQDFWNIINATNDETLYELGVVLQDLESRVLRILVERQDLRVKR